MPEREPETCMEPHKYSGTPDDRKIIITAVAAMIPSITALTGWRYVNHALVDGLLQTTCDLRP